MNSVARLLITQGAFRVIWDDSPVRAATMNIPSPVDKGMPMVYTYRPNHNNGDEAVRRIPSIHVLNKPDLPEGSAGGAERGQKSIVNILQVYTD